MVRGWIASVVVPNIVLGVALARVAAAQCVPGGPGGFIPTSGSGGGGSWPTSFPSLPLTSTLAVTVPPGATVLTSVRLHTLVHGWMGQLQIVLESPSGALYNLVHRPGFTGTGSGDGADFGGVYTLVDPLRLDPCSPAGPKRISLPTGVLQPGTYVQEFGAWTSGTLGVSNTPLESIPIASGNWKLRVYDWASPIAGSLANWELCFGSPSTPPPPPSVVRQCISGGPGGTWPINGGSGIWPTMLPPGELVSPLAVTVPPGATKIVAVELDGLVHTWSGDNQFVLQAPNGQKYNLFQNNDGVFSGGCSDPFFGDYVFVDALNGVDPCGAPGATFACSQSAPVPPGTYRQEHGAWPSGSSGILTTPLEQIPIASGTWSLICYDWFDFSDDGALGSWKLCFDGVPGPSAYCPPQAPGTTNGCLPAISATGHPNVAHSNPCVITVSSIEGQKSGLVFYGISGPVGAPWCLGGNSFLCVKAPTQRTQTQSSGGTSGACDGSLTLDWNAYQLANPGSLGSPWLAGAQANVQGWFRDPPACKTTFLSEAIVLTYLP